MPTRGSSALDIGSRDGHFSLLMADRFERVTALDLTKPNISHQRIECVDGNASEMQFADGAFDFVFCAEVLEHIPPSALLTVCNEIQSVARNRILISGSLELGERLATPAGSRIHPGVM
jgi:2-polyprenyl-3-methyl-5-hydroxy-6-metoxy-1,4-benzoquinol methylase